LLRRWEVVAHREVGGGRGRPAVPHHRPWVAVKAGEDLGLGFWGSGVWVLGLPCSTDLEREESGRRLWFDQRRR
jgi:hypothetical protein